MNFPSTEFLLYVNHLNLFIPQIARKEGQTGKYSKPYTKRNIRKLFDANEYFISVFPSEIHAFVKSRTYILNIILTRCFESDGR